jgi:DTW domain-containing protein YfiP
VIRHAQERGRASGTGRLIAATLQSGRVVDYALPGHALHLDGEIVDPAWLLYPDPARPLPMDDTPKTLIVLDGTWPQARRMRQRIPALRGLPILNLRAQEPGAFLREQRVASELPTALAVSEALRMLGEPQAAAALHHAYAVLRRKMIALGKTHLAKLLPGHAE